MKTNLKSAKILTATIMMAATFVLNNACRQTTNSPQNATPTPAANSTPDATRGCPAGTKPCGDACIPKKQSCGGN